MLGKELLTVFRFLVFELGIDHGKWPDLLPIDQSAINYFLSSQRNGTRPINAMNGLYARPPISSFYRFRVQNVKEVTELARD